MGEMPPTPDKNRLADELEKAWYDIQHLVESTSEEDLTTKTDPAGWSSKDHLAHVDSWLRSSWLMMRDRTPQWESLGVAKELYDEPEYDRENEAIRQLSQNESLSEVFAKFRETQFEVVDALRDRPAADWLKPVNAYVPGSGDFEIIHKINSNGPDHFREHLGYIRRILGESE